MRKKFLIFLTWLGKQKLCINLKKLSRTENIDVIIINNSWNKLRTFPQTNSSIATWCEQSSENQTIIHLTCFAFLWAQLPNRNTYICNELQWTYIIILFFLNEKKIVIVVLWLWRCDRWCDSIMRNGVNNNDDSSSVGSVLSMHIRF